jgi:PilZ domain
VEDERRRHPRITVLPADLRVADAKPYTVVAIIDLSLGGMKLEIEGDSPKVSALIDVTLATAKGDVKVNATVRHVSSFEGSDPHRYTVGVEFDDPDLMEMLAGDWIRQAKKR